MSVVCASGDMLVAGTMVAMIIEADIIRRYNFNVLNLQCPLFMYRCTDKHTNR